MCLEISCVRCRQWFAVQTTRGIMIVFRSVPSAANPSMIRANTPRSWQHPDRWRLPLTSTASIGCRASSVGHTRWAHRTSLPGFSPFVPHNVLQDVVPLRGSALTPLRLMKIMPLKTRLSSTRGRPWLFGKYGRRRAICASVSQNRLLMHVVSSRSLNHDQRRQSMGPDPKSRRHRRSRNLQYGSAKARTLQFSTGSDGVSGPPLCEPVALTIHLKVIGRLRLRGQGA